MSKFNKENRFTIYKCTQLCYNVYMRNIKLILFGLVAILLSNLAFSQTETTENREELFRIRLINDYDGKITVSKDQGVSYSHIGKVIAPAAALATGNTYTASKWAKNSSVAATAVNAMHIKTGINEENGRGTIFSILPIEFSDMENKDYKSYLNLDSSIKTDIKAGSRIFGGPYSPVLGSQIFVESTGNSLTLMEEKHAPAIGEIYVIVVLKRVDNYKEIILENKIDGKVYIKTFENDKSQVIGTVLHPISGVGRFEGSIYAKQGQIRANHNGVICVSTSNFNDMGGFQIIPFEHASSPEMVNTSKRPQWMVVKMNDEQPTVGSFPLFYALLSPASNDNHITGENGANQIQKSIIVNVKIKGNWRKMPTFSLNQNLNLPLQPFANTALKDVEAIKIILPKY